MSEGWKVVWVAFVVATFGWGLGFYGPAVYLPTLHATRGWSISTISTAITAHYLLRGCDFFDFHQKAPLISLGFLIPKSAIF